jgi:hydrogenase maturation protease
MLKASGLVKPVPAPPIHLFRGDLLRTLVLGLGNPILTDDGIGIHVVRAVAAHGRPDDVAFAEASVGGLRLLDSLAGYERVILVDAIQTPNGSPGAIYRLHPDDLQQSLHSGSSHDLSLSGALTLGRKLGMNLPDNEALLIFGIEVEDVLTFGEECTPTVQASIAEAADVICREILQTVPGTEPC